MPVFRFLGAELIIMLAIVLVWAGNAMGAECGRASWYGHEMCRPHRPCLSADGRRFNPNGLTIAMRKKPDGALYRVTYGGRSVLVRHTDYGPHAKTGRRYDLSRGAAVQLGMIKAGVGRICVQRMR